MDHAASADTPDRDPDSWPEGELVRERYRDGYGRDALADAGRWWGMSSDEHAGAQSRRVREIPFWVAAAAVVVVVAAVLYAGRGMSGV